MRVKHLVTVYTVGGINEYWLEIFITDYNRGYFDESK